MSIIFVFSFVLLSLLFLTWNEINKDRQTLTVNQIQTKPGSVSFASIWCVDRAAERCARKYVERNGCTFDEGIASVCCTLHLFHLADANEWSSGHNRRSYGKTNGGCRLAELYLNRDAKCTRVASTPNRIEKAHTHTHTLLRQRQCAREPNFIFISNFPFSLN